jgi:quercetin dioxygenase-like cupin family protein
MMKVQHYTEVPAQEVEGVLGVTVRWVIDEKDGAPHFAMRVFDVAPGHATPFHPHWFEHQVFVLSGQGALRGESGETPLEPGTVVFVPGDEVHQFINTGDDVFRFICLIPHDRLKGIAPEKA